MASSGSCMRGRPCPPSPLGGEGGMRRLNAGCIATSGRKSVRGYYTPALVVGKLLDMDKMHDLIRDLREPSNTKIVLMVADGLGCVRLAAGCTPGLESARSPMLAACVREGGCGLSTPVLPGITPGSGPGHLGLFGYDPLQYRIGRGILEALGINFPV